MRTTVDIPAELLERAKRLAASQNRGLSDLVNDGLDRLLHDKASPSTPAPFRVRPFQLGRTLPGVDLDDNDTLYLP